MIGFRQGQQILAQAPISLFKISEFGALRGTTADGLKFRSH